MKKFFVVFFTLVASSGAWAQAKMKFNFNNEELGKMIEIYALGSGQKFIVDSTVRGKATILLPSEINAEEAFDHLSNALAINGFAVVKSGDTMVVKNARSVQRDFIEVSTELPAARPQRMATWIVTLKNIPAEVVARELRLMTSSYGEFSTVEHNNQLVITDWTGNLQRVAAMIKQVDIPVSPAVGKIAAEAKKEREARTAKMPRPPKDGPEARAPMAPQPQPQPPAPHPQKD